MKYRLIAVDLDGTLLYNGNNIPEENLEAIRYAGSKGAIVVIATGRVTTSGRVFAKKLGLDTFVISSNGARVYDLKNSGVIFEDSMDINDAKAVVRYFESYGTYYHAYVDDIMYARFMSEKLRFYTDQNKGLPQDLQMDIRICEDYDSVFEKNIGKISKVMAISTDVVLLQEMKKHIHENGNIVTMASDWNNLEVMNHSVGKGNALKYLAGYMGISREEVVAVGDNENDISMIEWAGMGIAMDNATPAVKSMADHITDSCENAGVAKAIYKYI